MEEIWKDIIDSPNYEVSNFGNIRHKVRCVKLKPRANPKKNGYIAWEVNIADINGKQRNQKISRLVATAFLPNPDNLPQVDHIDRNPANNRLDNLRWITQSDNNRNTKLRNDNTSGAKGISYIKERKVYRAEVCINKKNIHIGSYKTIEEAINAREEWELTIATRETLKSEGLFLLTSNTSGYKNIHKNKDGKRWDVELIRNKIKYRIGTFKTIEEAVKARDNFLTT